MQRKPFADCRSVTTMTPLAHSYRAISWTLCHQVLLELIMRQYACNSLCEQSEQGSCPICSRHFCSIKHYHLKSVSHGHVPMITFLIWTMHPQALALPLAMPSSVQMAHGRPPSSPELRVHTQCTLQCTRVSRRVSRRVATSCPSRLKAVAG